AASDPTPAGPVAGAPTAQRPAGPGGSAPGADPAAAAEPEEKAPKQETFPLPNCWSGLLQFDQQVSLATFRAALDAAVTNRDQALAEYLQERLTELVGKDEAKALEVLGWADGSSQPELGVYMEALKNTEAVRHPKVVDRLLGMGENRKSSLVNRSAAVATLETQHHLDAASMRRLKAIALDESADSLSWMAARTLGKIMKEDFERTGNFQAYWDSLLDVAKKSDDMAVRLLALEMPSYSNPIIGGSSLDALSEIMRKDRERDVREMAAFRLAVTEEPDRALEAYKKAWTTEQDVCVRWAIFRFAVRALGPAALPQLRQWAGEDPRFTQDYQDFQKLYADGTVDFSRIWLGKEERHQCIVEEGAPH
ncbi:MAG TPA: HEAT repeat domain-containing protein, partial [Myxococcaceae bacterium]|nr:HEAT repeat domain-containing protein [Myxococcaceae bacterium]